MSLLDLPVIQNLSVFTGTINSTNSTTVTSSSDVKKQRLSFAREIARAASQYGAFWISVENVSFESTETRTGPSLPLENALIKTALEGILDLEKILNMSSNGNEAETVLATGNDNDDNQQQQQNMTLNSVSSSNNVTHVVQNPLNVFDTIVTAQTVDNDDIDDKDDLKPQDGILDNDSYPLVSADMEIPKKPSTTLSRTATAVFHSDAAISSVPSEFDVLDLNDEPQNGRVTDNTVLEKSESVEIDTDRIQLNNSLNTGYTLTQSPMSQQQTKSLQLSSGSYRNSTSQSPTNNFKTSKQQFKPFPRSPTANLAVAAGGKSGNSSPNQIIKNNNQSKFNKNDIDFNNVNANSPTQPSMSKMKIQNTGKLGVKNKAGGGGSNDNSPNRRGSTGQTVATKNQRQSQSLSQQQQSKSQNSTRSNCAANGSASLKDYAALATPFVARKCYDRDVALHCAEKLFSLPSDREKKTSGLTLGTQRGYYQVNSIVRDSDSSTQQQIQQSQTVSQSSQGTGSNKNSPTVKSIYPNVSTGSKQLSSGPGGAVAQSQTSQASTISDNITQSQTQTQSLTQEVFAYGYSDWNSIYRSPWHEFEAYNRWATVLEQQVNSALKNYFEKRLYTELFRNLGDVLVRAFSLQLYKDEETLSKAWKGGETISVGKVIKWNGCNTGGGGNSNESNVNHNVNDSEQNYSRAAVAFSNSNTSNANNVNIISQSSSETIDSQQESQSQQLLSQSHGPSTSHRGQRDWGLLRFMIADDFPALQVRKKGIPPELKRIEQAMMRREKQDILSLDNDSKQKQQQTANNYNSNSITNTSNLSSLSWLLRPLLSRLAEKGSFYTIRPRWKDNLILVTCGDFLSILSCGKFVSPILRYIPTEQELEYRESMRLERIDQIVKKIERERKEERARQRERIKELQEVFLKKTKKLDNKEYLDRTLNFKSSDNNSTNIDSENTRKLQELQYSYEYQDDEVKELAENLGIQLSMLGRNLNVNSNCASKRSDASLNQKGSDSSPQANTDNLVRSSSTTIANQNKPGLMRTLSSSTSVTNITNGKVVSTLSTSNLNQNRNNSSSLASAASNAEISESGMEPQSQKNGQTGSVSGSQPSSPKSTKSYQRPRTRDLMLTGAGAKPLNNASGSRSPTTQSPARSQRSQSSFNYNTVLTVTQSYSLSSNQGTTVNTNASKENSLNPSINPEILSKSLFRKENLKENERLAIVFDYYPGFESKCIPDHDPSNSEPKDSFGFTPTFSTTSSPFSITIDGILSTDVDKTNNTNSNKNESKNDNYYNQTNQRRQYYTTVAAAASTTDTSLSQYARSDSDRSPYNNNYYEDKNHNHNVNSETVTVSSSIFDPQQSNLEAYQKILGDMNFKDIKELTFGKWMRKHMGKKG